MLTRLKNIDLAALNIASHAHVCATADGSVVLDLKRDKYFGLGKKETELLAATIGAWPEPRCNDRESPPGLPVDEARAGELCRSLVEAGVLEQGVSGRRKREVIPADYMKRAWVSIGDELEIDMPPTLGDGGRFVRAFLWTRWSLACRPFWVTVEAIRANKALGQRTTGGARDVDTHEIELALLVDVFRKLRPFLFAAEGRCLLHALTLTRFLSCYGIYPDWVIGVATQPWAAHSWVQWGNFLLDTNPEKVCRFTPILVV